jgi:hypothetical protein
MDAWLKDNTHTAILRSARLCLQSQQSHQRRCTAWPPGGTPASPGASGSTAPRRAAHCARRYCCTPGKASAASLPPRSLPPPAPGPPHPRPRLLLPPSREDHNAGSLLREPHGHICASASQVRGGRPWPYQEVGHSARAASPPPAPQLPQAQPEDQLAPAAAAAARGAQGGVRPRSRCEAGHAGHTHSAGRNARRWARHAAPIGLHVGARAV